MKSNLRGGYMRGVRAPGVSQFRLTENCVPGERADVSIVDLATRTVADRAKIGDSPWERCTGR